MAYRKSSVQKYHLCNFNCKYVKRIIGSQEIQTMNFKLIIETSPHAPAVHGNCFLQVDHYKMWVDLYIVPSFLLLGHRSKDLFRS